MFIEVEIGFMVRYTIENNKYEGNRIKYSSCESPKLTSTTLNTNVITWDKLVTKTRHTTSLDTIPGTTSTTRVDTTQTYKYMYVQSIDDSVSSCTLFKTDGTHETLELDVGNR